MVRSKSIVFLSWGPKRLRVERKPQGTPGFHARPYRTCPASFTVLARQPYSIVGFGTKKPPVATEQEPPTAAGVQQRQPTVSAKAPTDFHKAGEKSSTLKAGTLDQRSTTATSGHHHNPQAPEVGTGHRPKGSPKGFAGRFPRPYRAHHYQPCHRFAGWATANATGLASQRSPAPPSPPPAAEKPAHHLSLDDSSLRKSVR